MRASLVVSLLALVVALGGTSYAAVKLARNSVKSPHIKNGQVKRADIGRAAVDSRRIANGTIVAADLAPGTVTTGERGPQGPAGPAGPEGEAGAPGAVPAEVTVVNQEPIAVDARRVDEGRFTLVRTFATQPGTGTACTNLPLPAGDVLIEKVYVRSDIDVHANFFVNAREGDGVGPAVNLPLDVQETPAGPRIGALELGVTVRDGLAAAREGEPFRDDLRAVSVCARDFVDGSATNVNATVNGRVLR